MKATRQVMLRESARTDVASTNADIARALRTPGTDLAPLRETRRAAGLPSDLSGSEIYEAAGAVAKSEKLTDAERQQLLGALFEQEIAERVANGKPAGDVIGDIVPLRERAVADDGSVDVKLIAPGWGSSGFYDRTVLERDVPKAFGPGTLMFWDHPTAAEEAARPEGSLHNLASVIVSEPVFQENGADGPGMYAKAKAMSGYKDAIDELAPHIGVSIRGDGKVSEGERDGKRGRIVEQISRGRSIDWVTTPGAGGKAVQLFESYRGGANVTKPNTTDPNPNPPAPDPQPNPPTPPNPPAPPAPPAPDPAPTTESQRPESEQRLLERLAVRDARDVIDEILEAKTNVPTATAKRLRESLPLQVKLTATGDADLEAFRTFAEKAVDDEVAYIAEASGAGRVRGNGQSADPKVTEQLRETEKHVDDNIRKLSGLPPVEPVKS